MNHGVHNKLVSFIWSIADDCLHKFLFDYLVQHKEQIEQTFGEKLEWLRMDDRKSSRIQFTKAVDGFNQDTWTESIAWHLQYMSKLEQALKSPLQKASEALKQTKFE